jgi:hypothetical protein
VDTDNNLLLCLLAVQTLGGRDVPAASAVFKGLKEVLDQAKDAKYVEQAKTAVPATTKTGKSSKKKVDVLNLTEEGRRFLQQAGSPEVAAAQAAGALIALRQGLEAERAALREQVTAALAAKGKGKEDKLSQEVSRLAKVVEGIQSKLQKLEEAVRGQEGESPLARIDHGFEALRARLDQLLAGLPAPSAAPRPEAARPREAGTPPREPPRLAEVPSATMGEEARPSLRSVLRNAYETLCCFREFEDGVVNLPRLYQEARQALPDLTTETFRREIASLWDKREVELHILNEVRETTELDKAIRRNENLYYFIYWPQP